MLRHELPTHLDVQDKMLLGLTVRQSMHLITGLAVSLALWHQFASSGLPVAVRVTAIAACLLGTAVLVLVRPHHRGLDDWAVVVLRYATAPRISVWQTQGQPAFRPATPGDLLDWDAYEHAHLDWPAPCPLAGERREEAEARS